MAPVSLTRTRAAIALRLFILGVVDASWWAQIALVKHELRLGSVALAIALAGAPAGLLCAVRLVPPLVARSSTAALLRASTALACGALVLVGLAGNVVALTLALLLLGVCNGTIDITVNVQAVAAERLSGRPIMSRLHAMWSLGTLLGGLGGAGAIALGMTPLGDFAIVAVLVGALGLVDAAALLPAAVADASGEQPPTPARLLRQPGLLALGAIAFCGLFAEGAVNNWGGVLIHQARHASYGVAALVPAGFGAGMLVGRLAGDALTGWLGRWRLLAAAAALAALVLVIAAETQEAAVAVAGFTLFGLPLAVIVPGAFSLSAGVTGVPPAWTIARLTTIGYVGTFSAPVIVGLIAGAAGLPAALVVAGVLLVAIVPAVRITRGRLAPG